MILRFRDAWLEQRFRDRAARLESNGISDEIQMSESVYRLLQDSYRSSDVHIVNSKGKGPTPARFLLGRNGVA